MVGPPVIRRPDVQRVFDHIAALAATIDPPEMTSLQQFAEQVRLLNQRYGSVGDPPSLEGFRFARVCANGVPATWATAEGSSPVHRIVYIHGGGWIGGSSDSYQWVAGTLAKLTGASVLLVDYRLAPENPFPAGLMDCVTALDWVRSHGPDQQDRANSTARSVGVVGDSAGGNLAVAACLRIILTGGRIPDRLAAISAVLACTSAKPAGRDDPIVVPSGFERGMLAYCADNGSADPLISPTNATKEALEQFPPTLLQVSGAETLLYDSKVFADRLEDAGARFCLSIWPSMPHVWHLFPSVLREAAQAVREIADFMRP
jgi:epsilon-lactone hydrolase